MLAKFYTYCQLLIWLGGRHTNVTMLLLLHYAMAMVYASYTLLSVAYWHFLANKFYPTSFVNATISYNAAAQFLQQPGKI